MADVRSLLRNELAARKSASSTTESRVTKKRKVDSGEDVTRKRLRSTEPPSAEPSTGPQTPELQQISEAIPKLPAPEETKKEEIRDLSHDESVATHGDFARVGASKEITSRAKARQPPAAVDEDEWAAFEREVVAPTRMAPAALAAAPTISAAPVTAEELASQKKQATLDNTSTAREAELEGEKEDAARFLEEEFEEMEQLEERVRRLKQMREELRSRRAADRPESNPGPNDVAAVEHKGAGIEGEANDEDDSDADDDWDDWRFK